MSSAPDARQVRAALVLSIGLSLVGMVGTRNGVVELALHVSPPAAPATTGVANVDAMNAFAVAYQDVELRKPFGIALASMNIVMSTMLLLGSFLLFARSKNTIWWVRNAAAANALHVVLDAITDVVHLRANMGTLTPPLRAWLAATNPDPALDASAVTGAFVGMIAVFVVAAVLRVAVEALLYWRVGSETLRGFLASGE